MICLRAFSPTVFTNLPISLQQEALELAQTGIKIPAFLSIPGEGSIALWEHFK